MAETLRAKLPPIYTPLLADVFDGPAVIEARATCDDCAMCDKGEPSPVPMEYFKQDLKCCTYHPYLPNFLIGSVFADLDPELEEGRRRLRAKIAARISVTPRWIAPPRKYSHLLEASRGNGFFGRSRVALCPFFDAENGGRCTVWRYRDNICSTYFCKFTSGKLGWDFWASLKEYLGYVEKCLSRWAALEVDPKVSDAQVVRGKLSLEDLEDRGPADAEYARFWGDWVGREEEFYIACHHKVRAMTREQFAELIDGPTEGQTLLRTVSDRYAAMSPVVLPKSLVRNPSMRVNPAGDNVVVTTYSTYDSFSLEKDLFDVLASIRADQTVEDNLARLASEDGIELAPELLQYLFTHGVLVAPPPKKAAVDMCATDFSAEAPKT